MTNKTFCVMATVYVNNRSKDLNGPFAETPEKAIKAFEDQMEKKDLQEKTFFNVFVAKKMDRATAPMANSKFGYDSVVGDFQGWIHVGPFGWKLPQVKETKRAI